MIRFLRILSVLICITIFGLGSFVLSFVLFPFGSLFVRKNKRREYYTGLIHRCWKFFNFLMQFMRCIKIHTDDELASIQGKIIVASHPSFIDIILLIGSIPHCICIAKQDLLKNPLLRNIVKNAYIVNDIDVEQFISNAKSVLDDGYNIVIFPTGTRTVKGEDIKIHKGAAQLAIASGVDIVPIKIDCDYGFMQKGRSMLDVGDKVVNYSLKIQPVISVKDYQELNLTDIKLRNHICEDIKKAIN